MIEEACPQLAGVKHSAHNVNLLDSSEFDICIGTIAWCRPLLQPFVKDARG